MSPLIENPLSWVYLPTALMLGALHALEPGHAKALTAAYLIGIKGTKLDALFLGLSVAVTHSFVVVLISVVALWIGKETFTQDVTHWLQIGSGVIVIILGAWMLQKRLKIMRKQNKANKFSLAKNNKHEHKHVLQNCQHDHSHEHSHAHGDAHHHDHDHDHDGDHDHSEMSDDEHARAHLDNIPDYVKRGERPTIGQIIAFGAAGGMIPCPASITVMLLALSVGKFSSGVLAVTGFSIGLAITLVGVGLIVVAGISQLQNTGRFHWFSSRAPVFSSAVVILSGIAALVFAH